VLMPAVAEEEEEPKVDTREEWIVVRVKVVKVVESLMTVVEKEETSVVTEDVGCSEGPERVMSASVPVFVAPSLLLVLVRVPCPSVVCVDGSFVLVGR
jgi:hypothetical protein